MRTSHRILPTRSRLALFAALTLLASCTRDAPNPLAPPDVAASRAGNGRVDVCHKTGGNVGSIIGVSANAVRAHIDHGDYIAGLDVDKQNTPGDGVQFRRISDAVRAADSTRRRNGEKLVAACRITVTVAAGTYYGSFYETNDTLESLPIFIGVPDITIQGALAMPVDGDSRALGASATGASIIAPDRPMLPNQGGTAAEVLVVIADDVTGYHGDRAIVENFRFRSGHDQAGTKTGGIGVGALRVQDLIVRGNHFEPTITSAIDFRASTATLATNYGRKLGAGCNLCIAGPGNYQITGNRVIEGGFVGLFIAPVVVRSNFPMGLNPLSIVVAAYSAPNTVRNTTTVTNNDLSDHRNAAETGMGIRALPFSSDAVGSPQTSSIRINGNRLYRNSFALSVDPNTPTVVSPSVPGNMDLALSGNTIGPSCRNSLLITFARFTRTFGSGTQSYLNNSTYTISLGGDTSWSDAWYDNSMGVGNTLLVDGVFIPPAKRISPSDNPAGCP